MEKADTPCFEPEYYRNRELSWTSFNELVLNKARNKNILLFK